MNEQPATDLVRPGRIRRLNNIVSARRGGMFGVAEVAALAGSGLVFLLVLFSYFYFLVPARSRLASLEYERAQLQANLEKYQVIVNAGQDSKKTVDEITKSLDAFETIGLVKQDAGRMGLYGDLNQMMVKNGLRNTSGPTYTPLEPAGAKSSPGKSTSTKWQSAYPGIAVAVTVEGPYQNVRHFIRDIERSKQFIIINQVELQRATQNNSLAVTDEAGSGSRGSLVSLQLNLATYFQRSDSISVESPQE